MQIIWLGLGKHHFWIKNAYFGPHKHDYCRPEVSLKTPGCVAADLFKTVQWLYTNAKTQTQTVVTGSAALFPLTPLTIPSTTVSVK